MPLRLSPTQVAFNARGDGKFNTPFQEQLDFFRQKLNIPTERYDDIIGAAHDRGFMVAGAAQADLLNDLRAAVDKAIGEGKSIGWFRGNFEGIIKKNGWEGWTGSDTEAGRNWRTLLIYRTNIASSYAAGRWQQLNDPRLLASRPYWKYIHNDHVTTPRPVHVSWSGLVLKHDDPWWRTHFPPNGWGCRCRVTAVRKKDYKGESAPDNGRYAYEDHHGNEHDIPKGIDYGWDTAPGRTWVPQLEKYPYQVAKDLIADTAGDGVLARWHERLSLQLSGWRKRPEYKNLGADALIRALRRDGLIPDEKMPVGIISPEVRDLLGADSHSLYLSADTLIKQLVKREAQAINLQTYLQIQSILDKAQVVKQDGDNKVAYWHSEQGIMLAVIKTTADKAENYFLSIRQASAKEVRRKLSAAELALLGID